MELSVESAPQAYDEILWQFRNNHPLEQDSRNGKVLRFRDPYLFQIRMPERRLVTSPLRDANPFFHCMEFIWMMAGRADVGWLAQFNKRYAEYGEADGFAHGAYGERWRGSFGLDQITKAVAMLKNDPDDRRVVIQMWDAWKDLGAKKKDLPCNTQLMFTVVEDDLNMLVTNRSNDFIWGALGANVVHMTMLQELIAQASGLELGNYNVISNNLHVYPGMPRFEEIFNELSHPDIYQCGLGKFPLLWGEEKLEHFLEDCEALVKFPNATIFATRWMINVGKPMYDIWMQRAGKRPYSIDSIAADDWRIACQEWLSRRGSHG